MAYLTIDSWVGGVDRRRPIYAGKPGTLWLCTNAHITNGGDIEKRKAFVDRGAFGANTFGLAAQGETLFTFGSDASATVPGGVTYVRLSHPFGAPMTRIVDWDLFSGRLYVAAEYADGAVLHFYDGALVRAWSDGVARIAFSSLSDFAAALAALIDASANYIATSAGAVVTVTAATAGTPFTVSTFTSSAALTLTDANTTPNVVAVTGLGASVTLSFTGGPGAGTVTSIRVGGVEVLGAIVTWATSNTDFATAVAAQINTLVSSPEYSATSTGQDVTITAAVVGTAANGLSVDATSTGTARVGDQAAAGASIVGTMTGGRAAVAAVAQVNTLTFGGTAAVGDRFGVKLAYGSPAVDEYFGNYAKPFGNASCVKTHKRKVYAGAASILDFSGVNSATAWNTEADVGAGFINISNHVGGSEVISSLETYQGRLAAFSRRAIQLWTMQNDDDLNEPNQILENTGTRSPHSTLEYAGNDVFYLDDAGIRSIKARDASNNAYASGVGAPINAVVRDWMRSGASDEEIERAASVVEPDEARFWMAIGTRIFVYSFFPETGIAAWSWYEPGFVVTDFARTSGRVWARADDGNLYLYGGTGGSQYDSARVTVELPFTGAQKDGTYKDIYGIDMAASGAWSVQLRISPNDLNQVVQMGVGEGFTYDQPEWRALGKPTHIAPVLVNEEAGYASLSKFTLYYALGEESS